MPIALLLEETTLAFRFGAKQLTPWVHLVEVEELLIDRARSAFLVHWFGGNLPLNGSYLKVVIDNLKELRDRFLQAKQSVERDETGPNLTEPLGGIIGNLAGLALSPTGVMMIVAGVTRKLKTWLTVLLTVLGTIIGGPLVLGLGLGIVTGIGTPLGLLGGLYLGGKSDEARALVGLLGAGARFAGAAADFFELLLGDRKNIGNPILQQMLKLLDRLAGLLPQLLGFVAVLVTRIGPLLVPMAKTLTALIALIDPVVKTLELIFDDLITNFKQFFVAKNTPMRMIHFVLDQLGLLFPALAISFKELFVSVKAIFEALFDRLKDGFKKLFVDNYKVWLKRAFDENPVVMVLGKAGAAFKSAADALKDKSPKKKKKKSKPSTPIPDFPDFTLPDADAIEKRLGGEPYFGLGDIEPIAKYDIKTAGGLFGPAGPFTPEARKAIEAARKPISVFALERVELEKSLGGRKAKDALADQLAAQQRLRDLISVVVGRVLPPELRIYINQVVGGFQALDENVFGKKPEKGKTPEFPIRDIDDNGKLKPVVHRVRVRARGATKLALEDFGTRLRKALLEQTYPAPVEP